MATDQTEQVTDHKAEALRLLEQAESEVSNNAAVEADYTARLALPHALLAIAEGQERVADELAKLRKTSDEQFTWWKRVSK